MKRLRNYLKITFLTGLLVLLPLALTYWILKAMLQGMERLIGDPLQRYLQVYIPGMGIILLVVLILLIGMLARNLIGRKLGALGEAVLRRIPLVRNIYASIKQLVNTIFLQGKSNFRGVVLVEYPRKGIYSLGFITGETKGEVQAAAPGRLLNVFVPTTPNPTSGYFILFPEEEVTHLRMSVEDGLKMIISAGMVTPPAPPRPEET